MNCEAEKMSTIKPDISFIASPISVPSARVLWIFFKVIPYVTPMTIKKIKIIGTIPDKNGECTIPPSSFVNGEFGKRMIVTISATYAKPANVAYVNPLISMGFISVNSFFVVPVERPSRGSTIFSVTMAPTIDNIKTEITMKYQLSTGVTTILDCNDSITSVEILDNKASD